jgi:hypothetical protein
MLGMSKRIDIRARYIQGWYDLNADLLLETTRPDFIFDDPAEPEPVTRAMLADYMHRWDARTRALGSTNQWILSNEVREDKDEILTDWEWWELVGSGLQGTAIIQTSDEGVFSERITYFDRSIRRSPGFPGS